MVRDSGPAKSSEPILCPGMVQLFYPRGQGGTEAQSHFEITVEAELRSKMFRSKLLIGYARETSSQVQLSLRKKPSEYNCREGFGMVEGAVRVRKDSCLI